MQSQGRIPLAITRNFGFYFRPLTITKNTPHQQVQGAFLERVINSTKAALLFLLTAVQPTTSLLIWNMIRTQTQQAHCALLANMKDGILLSRGKFAEFAHQSAGRPSCHMRKVQMVHCEQKRLKKVSWNWKRLIKSKLCQPKSPGHITTGENQHSKLSTTLELWIKKTTTYINK